MFVPGSGGGLGVSVIPWWRRSVPGALHPPPIPPGEAPHTPSERVPEKCVAWAGGRDLYWGPNTQRREASFPGPG